MASLTNISPSSPFLAFRKLTPNKPLLGLKKKPYSATCVHSTSDKIPPATLPPEVDKFLEWLCKQGVVSADCPVRPARVTEGLGLVAQRDIAEKEVILEIPRTLWISPDAVAASEIGNLCSELKPLMAVSLFLARENKREYSPWRIYLDILPKYTDSTVFWWVVVCVFIFVVRFCSGLNWLCCFDGSRAGLKKSLVSSKVGILNSDE